MPTSGVSPMASRMSFARISRRLWQRPPTRPSNEPIERSREDLLQGFDTEAVLGSGRDPYKGSTPARVRGGVVDPGRVQAEARAGRQRDPPLGGGRQDLADEPSMHIDPVERFGQLDLEETAAERQAARDLVGRVTRETRVGHSGYGPPSEFPQVRSEQHGVAF